MRVALLCLSLLVPALCPAQEQRPPNIVLLFIDDMGWRDVGFTGSEYYETPRIDALSKSGMVFTNAYSNGPNCAPSRACLMSGQYGPRHGIYTVGSSARGKSQFRKLIPIENETELDDGITTLAETLRAAGYATGHFGKWHLGADPCTQGFDVNAGGNRTGSPRGGYFSPWRNPQLPSGPKGEYLTDRLTDEAVKFMKKHRDQPFFVYLTHYAVHTPIQSKKELQEKYRDKPASHGQSNARYAAMIDSVDQSVGRVLDTLTELELRDDTVVVFTSDNGGHGPVTSMDPLRGSKGMLYEGGIRVPFLVAWPGVIEAGTRSGAPVIGLDLYPTLASIAGAPPPTGQALDGVDLLPVLKGRPLAERSLFWHFPAYLEGKRAGARTERWRTTPAAAIRHGRWKLLEFFEDGQLELYDLQADIGEQNNLADSMPDEAKELHAAMLRWRKATGAPVPTEQNPEYDPGGQP